VSQREGTVLCRLAPSGTQPFESIKFAGERETLVEALNVSCTVYPSERSRERAQVARLNRAMRDLSASNN
jgi:hypothetical protein